MLFQDRRDAGRRLAAELGSFAGPDVVVLGMPRGGVIVAAEVARELGAPLDVAIVRKLGVPYAPELAMGAIGEGGARVLNDDVIAQVRISPGELAAVELAETEELERRARRYRGDRRPADLRGKTVLIVDDGIATGATALAACRIARTRGAARVVLAVPVAPYDWTDRLGRAADELVCVAAPVEFFAIGQFYANFTQTTDEEVLEALGIPTASADTGDLEIPVAGMRLGARLDVPDEAVGVVVFAHGSGSSRHSPRNRYVAGVLNDAGLGTLLFDLLTADEAADRSNVFDTELLARRLTAATRWLRGHPAADGLPIGYFGASTGAAAALWAAAEPDADIAAIVSRGGRPDLAGPRLAAVTAPTLLIVGGADDLVVQLNEQANTWLHGESRVILVPGATHLFEEAGALEQVADLAQDWFTSHMAPTPVG